VWRRQGLGEMKGNTRNIRKELREAGMPRDLFPFSKRREKNLVCAKAKATKQNQLFRGRRVGPSGENCTPLSKDCGIGNRRGKRKVQQCLGA